MSKPLSLLKVAGKNIVDQSGKEVYLRGVNLGAWLNMEGYFLHGRNFGEHKFKREFAYFHGQNELRNFVRLYRNNFITYQDICRIKRMGANCLRLPFNYRLIEKEKAWFYLDNLINWCKREGIWVILDLHAAPGAQNPDWHSDSDGKAYLWENQRFQQLYLDIWYRLACRYKDEPTIAGYDVLNEPVAKNLRILQRLYRQLVQRIRSVDEKHIIFLEANNFAIDLKGLGKPEGENIACSIHFYKPINFVFNLQPQLQYPGYVAGEYWDKHKLNSVVGRYHKLAQKWRLPIYVGEFGVNYRSVQDYGELKYLKDVLDCWQNFGFHWTYWTYKAVANSVYPDGIYQYLPNSPWVKREGPVLGWENYYALWRTHKSQIAASWKTANFRENKYVSSLLAKYF